MEFFVAVNKDADSAYGVSVPDVPGCFAAGETREEALVNVKKAIKLHHGLLVEQGYNPKFSASSLDTLQAVTDLGDAEWVMVDVDLPS